jgi:hypothetical protein
MKFNGILLLVTLLLCTFQVAAQADDEIIFDIEQQVIQLQTAQQAPDTVKSKRVIKKQPAQDTAERRAIYPIRYKKTKSRQRRDLCSQLVLVTQTLPNIFGAPVSIFIADHKTDHDLVCALTDGIQF